MPRAQPLPPEERRAALIAATEPLLREFGRDVSTKQIAEAAGVAEGTIFRVFTSKEDLLDAVLTDAFEVRHTCAALQEIDPAGSLSERLVAAVTIVQANLRRTFSLFHALRMHGREQPAPEGGEPNRGSEQRPGPRADRNPAWRLRQEADNQLLNSALAAILEPDAGELRLDLTDAADALRSITVALTHPMLTDGRWCQPAQIVDLVLHGISTSPEARPYPELAAMLTPPTPIPSEVSC